MSCYINLGVIWVLNRRQFCNFEEQYHRAAVTAGELLSASRRGRGHLWHHAGMEKAASWLVFASWPPFKACVVVVLLFSPPLFSRRRRQSSVELASPPWRKPVSANVVFQYFLNVIKIAQLINK